MTKPSIVELLRQQRSLEQQIRDEQASIRRVIAAQKRIAELKRKLQGIRRAVDTLVAIGAGEGLDLG